MWYLFTQGIAALSPGLNSPGPLGRFADEDLKGGTSPRSTSAITTPNPGLWQMAEPADRRRGEVGWRQLQQGQSTHGCGGVRRCRPTAAESWRVEFAAGRW